MGTKVTEHKSGTAKQVKTMANNPMFSTVDQKSRICSDVDFAPESSADHENAVECYQEDAPTVENILTDRGLLLALYVLDRITGEHRPLVPGLFERAVNQHRKD